MQTRPETLETTNPNTTDGQIDPLNYPVAGQSLTAEKGAGNFEHPPENTDPETVLENIKSYIMKPDVKDELIAQLGAGFPVEAMVNMFVKGGVAKGKFSPDVAEVIKPPLAVFLITTALDEGVPVVPFTEQPTDQFEEEAGIESRMKSSMERLRPELASEMRAMDAEGRITGMANERQSRLSAKERISDLDTQAEVPSDGSFLEMGEE